MSISLKKKESLKNLNLTKKYYLLKKVNNRIANLKNMLAIEHLHKPVTFLTSREIDKNSSNVISSKKFLLTYIISFSFSFKNSLLHITDSWGNLKVCYSAGLVGVTGNQKKNRVLVLSKLFNILKRAKVTFIKNKPVALHLKNVGFYKYFIIKKLRKDFFIKIIKSYETYPYNGCRSKKKLHKRQRSKKRKRKNG